MTQKALRAKVCEQEKNRPPESILIASARALREAGFRRDFASLTPHQKETVVRSLLIRHIQRCKSFDLHKLRCVQKLVESLPSIGAEKK